jgi:hypothetical protein
VPDAHGKAGQPGGEVSEAFAEHEFAHGRVTTPEVHLLDEYLLVGRLGSAGRRRRLLRLDGSDDGVAQAGQVRRLQNVGDLIKPSRWRAAICSSLSA